MKTTTLLTVAGAQHGAISRRQLLDDVQISSSTMSRATLDGRLVRVGPGLFRLASAPDTFEFRCSAASLFVGEVGFVGGASAGRLYGLSRMGRARTVEVVVPDGFRRRAPDWIRLRYTNWFVPRTHMQDLEGSIRVATPPRLLFGLAARWNQRRFDAAADEAWHHGLIEPMQMARFLTAHRCQGKNGVIRLERWIERALLQEMPSESYLERDLIDAIASIGLPVPARQHRLALRSGENIRLDIAWPGIRFAVEPGHSYFHRLGSGQERDHRRDAACAELGWLVLRLNETMLTDVAASARLVRQVYHRRCADLGSAA